jgi:hypothetical protein
MPAPQENASVRTKDLDTAADQAIAVCGGDAREAVKALIAANDFLESQVEALRAAVSTGYSRGRYDLPRDRKDWYD